MEKITRETVTTQGENNSQIANNSAEGNASGTQTVEYLVYFIFGIVEILLTFRLVLKLLGASLSSTFVGMVYDLSGIFVSPFEGIFRRGLTEGVETTSVFEPGTIIAIIVYAVVAWGIVQLVRIFSGKKQLSE